MGKVILEMRNIVKRFPNVLALNGVNLKVYEGKAMALLGENGAGKSTLMKVLTGVYTRDEGEVIYNGKDVTYTNARAAQEGGHVAEIQGMAGASAANERHEGFDNVMGAAENIEVVSSQIGDWDQTKAQEIMTNVLTASPDVKTVFCANDNMALGAIEACKIAGREDIVIVGFDAIDDAVAAVEEGTLAATIQQLPEQIGVSGVQNAIKVLNGEAVDAFVGVEVQLVTK